MSASTMRVLTALWFSFLVGDVVRASILGHSGVVLHVDKWGHLSGHSSHYDYRFYPEELHHPLPLLDHHNIVGHSHHHHDDLSEAFALIEDEHEYHHKPYPYYHLAHDDHHHGYEHHHHLRRRR